MQEFHRISRLPPYVFNIVNELKAKARAATYSMKFLHYELLNNLRMSKVKKT